MVTEHVWKNYFETGEVPTGIVSQVVIDSWNRCRTFGLNPMGKPINNHATNVDLAEKKVSRAFLLKAGHKVVNNILESCRFRKVLMVISDECGYILEMAGDIKVLNQVQLLDITIGACWLEEYKGTNGIGTVLNTRQPLQLSGFDHYFKMYHGLDWYSAPIILPDGTLAGVISLLNFEEGPTVGYLGIVKLASENLTMQLAQPKNSFGHSDNWAAFNKQLLENTPHAIILVDKTGIINCLNSRCCRYFANSFEDKVGKYIWDLKDFGGDSLISLKGLLLHCLQSGRTYTNLRQKINTEYGDQTECSLSLYPVKNNDSQIIGVTFVIREITCNRLITMEDGSKGESSECFKHSLATINTIDNLTRLYNRKVLSERIDQLLNKNTATETPVAILLIDIDHFKHYNELMGFEAGDKLLVEVAGILRGHTRERDLVARYGGEEFAVILDGADQQILVDVSSRLKTLLENHNFFGKEVQPGGKVTFSMGFSGYPQNGETREELIKSAEEALFAAQKARQNKISFYFTVFDELKDELNNSDLALFNTIRTLITVINAKDRYTYGHSERVVLYSTALAQNIGLSSEEIKYLRYGAYLHDIGKIEISREILNKSESLSESEWEVLKNHPQWGAEIIKPVSALKQILPQILYHHERYDGTGYPEGLTGEEIPLTARILTIADCFDAMTTDRPYQKAIGLEKAIQQLQCEAGRAFDPDLVVHFIEIVQDIYSRIQK